jgi:hypothetical protein
MEIAAILSALGRLAMRRAMFRNSSRMPGASCKK